MEPPDNQSPPPETRLAGWRKTLSRGVSQFLVGQRGAVERNNSFWRHQHQPPARAEPEAAAPAAVDYSSSDDDYSSEDEPWWMQDALWDLEDLEEDIPTVPPPSYAEAVASDAPQFKPGELHYELPELKPPPTYEMSIAHGDDQGVRAAGMASVVIPPLKLEQTDQAYKGRGRGRNRNQMLRRAATARTARATNQIVASDPNRAVSDDELAGRGPLTRAASLSDIKKLRKRPPTKAPRVKVLSKPYFIATVSIIQCVLMAWELIVGGGFLDFKENPFLGPGADILIWFGGKWVPSMRNNGEWWRFFTGMFLHSGLIHVAFNMLSQLKVGFDLERVHGTYRLFPIYILSGLFGNVCSAIFLQRSVTVGASGAIFGFFGVLLVDLIKNWKKLPSPGKNLAVLLVSIAISFAFGLMPGVDNWAHGGGFVMGLLSGVVFLPSMHIGKFNLRRRLLQVLISLPLMVGAFVAVFWVFYSGVPADFCPWCAAVTCLPVFPACRS